MHDDARKTSSPAQSAWTTEATAWQHVQELLGQALDLEPHERPGFLDQACAGHDSLRREIERLLATAEEMGDFIEEPLASLCPEPEIAERDADKRIGRYKIRHEIGRGGIGAVYLAVRADDTFEKQVAVKLLKRGMDTDDIVRRFHNERQILADLDHPHIARLLDGGSTGDGLPYLVMEYVEGEPLDRYCDGKRLPINRRLELFVAICAAVSQAHRNLVVHRDLKPGNILVGAEGEPKLLDFGIAKVLSPQAGGATTAGSQLMTPEYASPEQLRGESVTTATDIYSLGVLLYELLTGRRPYRLETRSPGGLARAIATASPPRPSLAVTHHQKVHGPQGERPTPTPEQISALRGETPERLRRRLEGDLDAIVMMAIAKERRERYSSVEQLAKDVERHLVGQPVLARKHTLAYRAEKYLRRNWPAVAVASAFLILILAFALYEWRQSDRLAAALETARQQQAKAERERTKAQQVAGFLEGLFDNANPERTQGKEVTVRDILDRGSRRINEDLEGQPEVQADLTETMGRAFRGLGFYEEARSLLESALATRRVAFGGTHPKVAASLQNLAVLLHEMEEYEAAEQYLRESLSMLRQIHPEGRHTEIARALHGLARTLDSRGDLIDAQRLYQEALDMKRELHGAVHADVATTLNSLASLLATLGDHTDAEQLYREALDIRLQLHGPEHLEVARSHNNLATIREAQGDYTAAKQLLEKALAVRRKILGEDHPGLKSTLNNLAAVSEASGDLDAAVRLYEKTLDIQLRWYDENHTSIASCRNNLAYTLALRGEFDRASELFEAAFRGFRETLGVDHFNVGIVQRHRAWLLTLQEDYAGAEWLIREALTILLEKLPDEHWRLADARSVLGASLAGQGRFAEAETLLVESFNRLRRAEGPPPRFIQDSRDRLIDLYSRTGRSEKALEYSDPETPQNKPENFQVP